MTRSWVIFPIFLLFLQASLSALSAEDLKKDIYSKLRDRRCTEMTLAECNCPEAREMKGYIDALLEAGVSKEEIFYKVAKRYSLAVILDENLRSELKQRLIQQVGQNRPQIVLKAPLFNFGKVSKKQLSLNKIINVYNKGKSALIITNIKVSCGCITASLKVGKNKSPYFGTAGAPEPWQEIIPPGKSGQLEIVLDLAHSSIVTGKLTRNIFISSNDPLYPEITLRIEAEITD